jgi:hypothetical protein
MNESISCQFVCGTSGPGHVQSYTPEFPRRWWSTARKGAHQLDLDALGSELIRLYIGNDSSARNRARPRLSWDLQTVCWTVLATRASRGPCGRGAERLRGSSRPWAELSFRLTDCAIWATTRPRFSRFSQTACSARLCQGRDLHEAGRGGYTVNAMVKLSDELGSSCHFARSEHCAHGGRPSRS